MNTFSSRLLIASLALAVWLIGHPFRGIWHDSVFYTLQALQHLNPGAFAQDLFFLYGSQDQFSLFSRFHAAAISVWGLDSGTMALLGLGLGLWFAAAGMLTRVVPGKLAALSLLLVVVGVDGQYGSHGVFSYGESFLTARLYAEAFSLAGLAAWLSGRKVLGGMAFAVACAMHPLMALPALVIGLGMLLRPAVWLGLMGAGGLSSLGLGVAGVAPFTGLLQPMDPVWWQLAVSRSPFVFLHTWDWDGFSRALYVVVVTGIAWRILPEGALRRLAGVTLVCVLGAFAMAYVGGSLLKLPLIAGLQLTRVMWIALVITLMLIPAMLWEYRRQNIWGRVLVWGLAFSVFLDSGTQGAYALLVLAIFLLGGRYLPDYRPPAWFWGVLALIPLQIMVWGMLQVHMAAQWDALFMKQTVWRIYLTNPATSLVLAAGAYWLSIRDRMPRLTVAFASMAALGALFFAAMTWYDLQPGMDYESPARRAAIAPVKARIANGATVYWVEEPEKAWFWLGRANYLSFSQTAGSVFSRGTAVEALRRAAYVRQASLRDASQDWDQRFASPPSGLLPKAAIEAACRDPILDYVIARGLSGGGTLFFKDPATAQGYRLYDCRTLRAKTLQYRAQLP